MSKLTPKQELFCSEYLIDLNATAAAERAGYNKKTAYSQGQRLLKNVEIQKIIQMKMNKRARRTEITQDKVLQELAKIGFADIKDFLSFKTVQTVVERDEDTNEPIIDYKQIVDMKPSDEVDGTLINEISIAKDGTLKFKLHDKLAALEKIGKHLKMFTDKVETEVSGEMQHKVDVSILTPEERKARIEELKKKMST